MQKNLFFSKGQSQSNFSQPDETAESSDVSSDQIIGIVDARKVKNPKMKNPQETKLGPD